MEAKISNKTTLTYKNMVIATILNNRFIFITYSILFVVFLGIITNMLVMKPEGYENRLVMDVMLCVLCFSASIVYPVVKAYIWLLQTKKKYGTNTQEIEYQYYDLHMKVINHTANVSTKIDYRSIYKLSKTKKYQFIGLGREFVLIDKTTFKKPTDFDKVMGYIKRVTKL